MFQFVNKTVNCTERRPNSCGFFSFPEVSEVLGKSLWGCHPENARAAPQCQRRPSGPAAARHL